jgi:hypothetical protein
VLVLPVLLAPLGRRSERGAVHCFRCLGCQFYGYLAAIIDEDTDTNLPAFRAVRNRVLSLDFDLAFIRV